MTHQTRYNASLLGAPDMPAEKRKAAEEKFLQVLERIFGSASAVRGTYCEYLAVRSMRAENPKEVRTAEEQEVINRWETAAGEATQSVFRLMNIAPGTPVFELHVWNSRTR